MSLREIGTQHVSCCGQSKK
jgi:predicted DNA-binding ribbon-helix-helix protein